METVIRCQHPKCNKNITKEAQYYDKQKDGKFNKVYCGECNQKIRNSYYE